MLPIFSKEKREKPVDYKLFFAVVILVVFWMIMISSVSVYSSFKVTSLQASKWLIPEAYNYYFVSKNIMHVIIGFIVMALVVKIPYSYYEKYSKHFLLFVLVLLMYVLAFWLVLKWAKWWIDIPWLPSIQPTELLKPALILFLAYFFKRYKKSIRSFYDWFLPFFFILGFFVAIVWLQPDFGTVMVIVPVSIIMFFMAGANVKYLTYLFLSWILLVFSVYSMGKYDKTNPETRNSLSYITERIDYFVEDSKKLFEVKIDQKNEKTYQIKQALITIWSWGFAGLWFWQSIQKFWYLPEVQWDFIFSVIVEELWFIWGFLILSIYLYIWYRGFYIYSKVTDLFAKYTALWISSRFMLQAFINIWVNLNIVPLTWITLPFVSYWGSSLITLMFSLWILLNISRDVYNKPKFPRLWRVSLSN